MPQHITTTPHGFDVVFAARSLGKLLAQLAHEHIDYFDFRFIYSTVEVVQEHFLGERHSLAQRKELQHLVLLAGKMHARAADLGGLGTEADYEVVGLDDGPGVAPGARIKWMFTTAKARAKMGRAYPEPAVLREPQIKES